MSGVDTAERLVEIAAASAAAEGLPASFSIADAKALPFEDATFDVIVSVMGIIFAPDAPRALSEALRVLRPGGRAFLSAWCPGGAIDAMIGVMVSGVAEVLGPPPARFRWGDAGEVRVLAQELGSEASVHDGTLVFTAESPEAYLAEQEQDHPSFHWSRDVLSEHASDPERSGAGRLPGCASTTRTRPRSAQRVATTSSSCATHIAAGAAGVAGARIAGQHRHRSVPARRPQTARLPRARLLLPSVRPARDPVTAVGGHELEHPARSVRDVHRAALDAPRGPGLPVLITQSGMPTHNAAPRADAVTRSENMPYTLH